MPIFKYRAKDSNGVERLGEIESNDVKGAVSTIRKKGLVVISVTSKDSGSFNFLDKWLNRVGFSNVVTTTRQLSTMIGAGLVLSDAIDILHEQESNKRLKKIFEEISQNIKGGLTLSQSLAKYPDVFPPLYVNLVKSGEASGKLDEVLLKMADSLEKEREFRSKIKGALIYPAVVITMMGVVVLIMIVFVIPKLTALYRESSLELPLPTKILIGVSDFVINFWWLLIILVILTVVLTKRWVSTPQGGIAYDRLLLRIPIIGKIITDVTLTTFARTFGLLTSAGIPLLECINIVADVTENKIFKITLKDAYAGVSRGLSFSSLLGSSIFPKIVPQMVKVGEETGKVDEVFFKLADYFESESDHMVKNLTVAIEPIVLVVLGIGVAFLVISIILPIYQLTTSF